MPRTPGRARQPISEADVLEMRAYLADYQGDVRGLFEGPPDERRPGSRFRPRRDGHTRMSEAGTPRDHLAGSTFAHASEAEFARILDFYEVTWEYEPQVFPILWDLDGNVLESFAPDFFLPDLDLYIELTTLQQRLVRKKNRKVRRLRELYPSLRIKLFYARDFRALMLKYGRSALVSELSGTLGQVGPRQNPEPGPEASSAAGHHRPPGGSWICRPGPPMRPLDPRASHDRRSRGARRRAVRRAAAAYAPNSTAT